MPAIPPDPLPTADLPNNVKTDVTHSIADPAAATGAELNFNNAATEPILASPARYTLGDEIARGGMGIIYQATDTTLNRQVVLKVLQNKYALNSAAIRRFSDEARIAAQLQHPSIPPIHDLGTLPDGRPFLAMKLIKGDTLESLLAARQNADNDRGRFVAAFEQVCQAIAYAHAHSVIHRDLKPANIMVGSFGVVQVMDWGLAKVLRKGESETQDEDPATTSAGTVIHSIRDSDGTHTQAGSVLGTPAYMPPEQAVGAIGQINERSDVFGLGAILAVILTGQPPFMGSTAETTRIMAAQGKVEGCLARLDACGADPELVALCKRCLAPLQTDRPQDASEVAKAVAELRSAADERARQAELDRVRAEGERVKAEAEVREQRKRRRVQMVLAAVVVFMLFGIGAFGWWQDRQAAAQRDRLARNAESVTTLLDQTEEALKADDPDRAEVALTQAEKQIGDGGADSSRERLNRLRADRVLLRELDKIDNKRWTHVDGRFPDVNSLAQLWAGAFVDFGIVPGTTSVEEAATLLSKSAIRDRASSALSHWFMAARSADVVSILVFSDPDPFRTEFHEAIRAKDTNRLKEMAQSEATLAQPAWFVALASPIVSMDRRRELLERALVKRPGNLALLMDLGNLNPMNRKEGAEERIRWYQAAVSTHPRNLAAWNSLGSALGDKGDVDEAIACFREAIRLDPQNAYPHNNLGNVLKANGDWDGAIASYKEAIRLDPKLALAHNNLGWILWGKGESAAAIASYNEAIRLDPKLALAHNNLGWCLWEQGDEEKAIASVKEALRHNPKLPAAHNNLGNILYARGDVDGAIASYKEAIRLDPKDAPAHSNMGNMLVAKGDLDGATIYYKQAIQFDPKYALAHNGLGQVLGTKDDLDGSIACIKEAIRLDPKLAWAHNNMGHTLRKKGEPDAAISYLKEAIQLNPKFALAHNNMGLALWDKGEQEKAIACFQEAIRLDPKYAPAHNSMGNALKAKDDVDGAIACYETAIRLDPKYALAHNGLGYALGAKGDLDRAIACFEEATKLDPKFALAHNNLGIALGAKGDVDGAIAHYKKAIELNPKLAVAHYGLGFSLGVKGNLEAAIASSKEAIRLDPKLAPAHISLGLALKLKGDLDEAIKSFQEAIRLDPKNLQAQNNLAQTRQWQALLPHLDEIVDGRTKPKTPAVACSFATLCAQTFRKQYAAAVRLYTNAFAENPKLMDDLDNVHRYNAARCAALAGCGKGVDAPNAPDDRLELRRHALEWLRADIALQTSLAKSNPAARQFVAQQMMHWLMDADLAGVRPGTDQIQMSAKEQDDWDALWMDVKALLAKTQKQPSLRPIAPPPREIK